MRKDVFPEEFFYDLAKRASDRMLAELPSEEELSKQLSISPECEQKIELMFANPNLARAQPRRALRVLAIAAVILVVLFSALMSVSAVREAVFEFFTELYEKYVVAWYAPEDDTITAPETILEFREPGYVPPGYERSSEEKTDVLFYIFYTNIDGKEIVFEQSLLDSIQFGLDIEAETEKELFEINGTTGMYRIKHELLEVVWTDNEYSYRITGQIEPEQAMQMAHSTK